MPIDLIIQRALERLDAWRHLPAYRLEPRADMLFAAVMADLLAAKLGHGIREPIIPEFPIRRGLLHGNGARGPNASVKVDYLAVSSDNTRAYLVELKTDDASRRPDQDTYLCKAKAAGAYELICGVIEIVKVTSPAYLGKYLHLLYYLRALGWVSFPDTVLRGDHLSTVLSPPPWLDSVSVSPAEALPQLDLIYIQPNSGGSDLCLGFDEAAVILDRHESEVARLFGSYLRKWTSPAGLASPLQRGD